MLGPNWEKHFRQLAKELDLARALKLPLSILGTTAGGPPTELTLDPNADPNADPANGKDNQQ